MSSDNSPPPSPTQRRASFAPGTKLSEMFGRTPGSNAATSNNNTYQGPIAAAAANASRRRMSISTLGLSGSPNQTSPFNPSRPRQESYSSTSSSPGPDNESAIDESGESPPAGSSPFARRMSFGARAMRDARSGGSGSFNGEGFNWSDQIRSRAERSASIASPTATAMPSSQGSPNHVRSATVAAAERPTREPAKQSKAPDHFQERILKGDFYMD